MAIMCRRRYRIKLEQEPFMMDRCEDCGLTLHYKGICLKCSGIMVKDELDIIRKSMSGLTFYDG